MARLGDAIRRLREERYWTQDELAAKAGVSRATVQKAERAASLTLSGTVYRKLAEGLGLTPDALDKAWRGDALPQSSHRVGAGMPLINKTPAGPPQDFEDAGHDHYEHLPVMPDALGDADAFAIEVDGDSMTPEFHPGDAVICSPAAQITDGDVVFVRFGGRYDETCTLKRVYDLGESVRLEPDNKRHKPMVVAKDDIVRMSRVIAKFVDYRRPGR